DQSGCGNRWADRNARRPARSRSHDRRRPARDSARRPRVSRHDVALVEPPAPSPGAGAGYRRRDPRPAAGGLLLGVRGGSRGRSRTNEAGGRPLGPVAQGRGVAAIARFSFPPPGEWAERSSFHATGFALIVPTRNMNSAYFIVPSGTVENFESESLRILTISSTEAFCFETVR